MKIGVFKKAFFMSIKELSRALQDFMIQQKKTLVLAESCTGGFLAHAITQNPDASKYFLGSFVTYSNTLKTTILGVREETLHKYSAESEQTTLEMLEGLFRITPADVALAITGIAGPSGGTEHKPVGTVWIALGVRDTFSKVHHFTLTGNRKEIIEQASLIALQLAYARLLTAG